MAVVDVGVDEDLDRFVGAVGEQQLVSADVEVARRGRAWPRRTRDRRRAGSASSRCFRNSMTFGEQPTVFSLKSRRSLSARPPVGGE